MSTPISGRAILFGADGSITWTGIASGVNLEASSIEYTDKFELKDSKSSSGQTLSIAAVDPTVDLTIEVIPYAASGSVNSLANAAAAMALPGPLAVITTSGFAVAAHNGAWNYIGGGKLGATAEGFVKMTLPLRSYNGAALTPVS